MQLQGAGVPMKPLTILLAVVSLPALTGCVTSGASPTLEFAGSLDFSRPGVRFLLTHPSCLTCEGKVASARVPEKFSVPLACNENLGGTMEAIKSERIEGTIVLADNRTGKVTFDLPLARRDKASK